MWVWSKLSGIQWSDAWEERFHGNPNTVITEIKGGKSVRVEVYCETEAGGLEIKKQFGGSVRELKSQNWAALGPANTSPIVIRDRLVISPIEDRESVVAQFPDRDVITIPAEMAFGTGDHPTTSTCLRFLVDSARRRKEGWTFLDLGTGSGVLALAAKFLGAGKVEAFDYDAKAVEVAQHNAERNGVSGLNIFEADVFEWTNAERFEVVAANLFSTVLLEALPLIAGWILPSGRLILSGILAEQWPDVEEKAKSCGFELLEFRKRGKWVTASFDASS
ncbi:MAG: 50S ribosomal protein L11 methyltransferase [Verrucomicrobiaceae bacterium]